MSGNDIQLSIACAERLELEAELNSISLEVSEHDAARQAELASHQKAVECLSSQMLEARRQLTVASEVVISLESMLVQERKTHNSKVQAFAGRNALSLSSYTGLVASDAHQKDGAEAAALHAKLLAAGARANRKRELLAESEIEGAGLAEAFRKACEARPEFAQLAHDASMRSAKAYVSRKLKEFHQTKHELTMLRAQLEKRGNDQSDSSSVSVQRLTDLRTALANLQEEARSRADDIDLLRTEAAEDLREAVEAETRLRDFENHVRSEVGQEMALISPQLFKRTESPGASTRSPDLGNTAANVNVSAVSRRLSFSPFDLSRDFMPDVESPIVDNAGSLDAIPSDDVVGDSFPPITRSLAREAGRLNSAAVPQTVETSIQETIPRSTAEAQRRHLLAVLANAKKQFTSGS